MASPPSPLKAWVQEVWDQNPGARRRFIESLGYSNINKAYQQVDAWLRTGEDPRGVLEQLREDLQLEGSLWTRLLKATRELATLKARIQELELKQARLEQCEEQRRRFVPYIWVLTHASRPTGSITIYALANLGRFRYVSIEPEWLEASQALLQKRIGERVHQHFVESEGICNGMGAIRGYEFHHAFGQAWEFDPEGHMVASREVEERR
jgi:hypothetical protein